MKTKKLTIGNIRIEFTSDEYRGELLDTIVTINGADIMTIAGNDIENVIKVLKNLNAYRI